MSLVISVHLDLQNILLSGQVLKRGEGCFGASEPPKGAANETLSSVPLEAVLEGNI